jgi:cell division protein FtsZ
VCSGEHRAVAAAEKAIKNRLLDNQSLEGARGLLINISGGDDLTMVEVEEAANIIQVSFVIFSLNLFDSCLTNIIP